MDTSLGLPIFTSFLQKWLAFENSASSTFCPFIPAIPSPNLTTHFAILFLTVLNVQITPLALDSHVSRVFTFQTFCYHKIQLIRNVSNATIEHLSVLLYI